jgi:hypothetical protein
LSGVVAGKPSDVSAGVAARTAEVETWQMRTVPLTLGGTSAWIWLEEYLGRVRRNEAVAQHDMLHFGEVRRAARIDHVGHLFEIGRAY